MEPPDLLAAVRRRFETEETQITIRDKSLRFLQVKNALNLIEQELSEKPTGKLELPYWMKIWEASIVLADHLAGLPPAPGAKLLELGAGLGVPGIFAAALGYQVTITDNKEDALLLSEASARLNGINNVTFRRLDWTKPDLNETFDVIIGSEVLYVKDSLAHLKDLLNRLLAPQGRIYLARGQLLPGSKFIPQLAQDFQVEEKTKVLHSPEEVHRICLYTLSPKPPGGGSGHTDP